MEEVVARDVKARTFSTHTYNVTWADTASMEERTTYTKSSENSQWYRREIFTGKNLQVRIRIVTQRFFGCLLCHYACAHQD